MREEKRENKGGMCYADEDVQAPKKEMCFAFKSVHVVFYAISNLDEISFFSSNK